MSGKVQIAVSKEQIAEVCRKWQVSKLCLFGSVLREDFGPESDIDVLVTFDPEVKHSVADLERMKDELSEVFGRKVDLVERRVVEQSPNYIRRRQILDSAEVLYGA